MRIILDDGGMIWVQAELGKQLAEMHKASSSEKGFGFDVDNTIGRSVYTYNSNSLQPKCFTIMHFH